MPEPLANRISAIDAPVSSLRHSIFSEMPFSDFSRHGILSVSIRISSSLGAPSGSFTMRASYRFLRTLYRQPLEVSGERMHPPRAGVGDLYGLGEYAAGLAVLPLRIEQVDVECEHHSSFETVAHDLDRLAVGGDGMMAVARIFQRGEAVAVDTGFADGEAARDDLVFHRFHRGRDGLAGTESLEPFVVSGHASFIDFELLRLRLAEAECPLDMGEVAADL